MLNQWTSFLMAFDNMFFLVLNVSWFIKHFLPNIIYWENTLGGSYCSSLNGFWFKYMYFKHFIYYVYNTIFNQFLWFFCTCIYILFLLLNVCPQYLHLWVKESGKWTLSMCFTRLFFFVHSFPQTVHCHPEFTPDFVKNRDKKGH